MWRTMALVPLGCPVGPVSQDLLTNGRRRGYVTGIVAKSPPVPSPGHYLEHICIQSKAHHSWRTEATRSRSGFRSHRNWTADTFRATPHRWTSLWSSLRVFRDCERMTGGCARTFRQVVEKPDSRANLCAEMDIRGVERKEGLRLGPSAGCPKGCQTRTIEGRTDGPECFWAWWPRNPETR